MSGDNVWGPRASLEKSFFGHNCLRCGRKIPRNTKHVIITTWWGVGDEPYAEKSHFCDPVCAQWWWENHKKEVAEDALLQKIIFGE